jgi:hypothetical protein
MTAGDSPRTLSKTLAVIVADLELSQPVLVDLADLEQLIKRHGGRSRAREVAHRLRERGWLLATARPGVFEFAPAAHAGPFGHGDPFIDLRAELRSDIDLPARLALHSALWIHGLADRAPDIHEVLLPPRVLTPTPLARSFRVLRFEARLAPEEMLGLPVSTPATVLVHLAARPTDIRNWPFFFEAIKDLTERTTASALGEELAGRPASVFARFGYLLQGVAPHLIDELGLAPASGVVWFGPRGQVRRFDPRWNIADTILPFDPRDPEGQAVAL